MNTHVFLPLVDISLGWISHSIYINLYKCCIYKIDTPLILADCDLQQRGGMGDRREERGRERVAVECKGRVEMEGEEGEKKREVGKWKGQGKWRDWVGAEEKRGIARKVAWRADSILSDGSSSQADGSGQ